MTINYFENSRSRKYRFRKSRSRKHSSAKTFWVWKNDIK
ncbi:hypothetical protein CaCOL14_009684 [Colletotrichum acutatum]